LTHFLKRLISKEHGKVAERFNASVLKTEVLKSTVGSNPTLSSTQMQESEKKKATGNLNKELQLNPELNPPENIDELECLISRLQNKAINMRLQLEDISSREKDGLFVDYDRVKRLLYARTRTNKSISALQRIVKQKRREINEKLGYKFEQLFMLVAKEELPLSKYKDILNICKARYEAKEALEVK
jgi:hypothetical protein